MLADLRPHSGLAIPLRQGEAVLRFTPHHLIYRAPSIAVNSLCVVGKALFVHQ